MILVDTSVLSRAFRRKQPGPRETRLRGLLDDLFAAEVEMGIPGLVLQEILGGVRSALQFAALERELRDCFHVVLPGVEEHVAAAWMRNACVEAGVNVSAADCLIACQSIAGDHELLADDADFELIAERSDLTLFRRSRRK